MNQPSSSRLISARRGFLYGLGAATLAGCAASTGAIPALTATRKAACNNYQSVGRHADGTRNTECVTGGGGALLKGEDSAAPISATQSEYLNTLNLDQDAYGNQVWRKLLVGGGYTLVPFSGGVSVYYIDAVDYATAGTILDQMQAIISGISYAGADAQDSQTIASLISSANAAIQTAYASRAPADVAAAATATGAATAALPYIGGTTAKPYNTGAKNAVYTVYQGIFRPQYADRNAMEKPHRDTSCSNQKSTMRRIAQAAIDMFGMVTGGIANTGGGVDACAWAVENAIYNATGDYIVGGGGNTNWVPDVSKGLTAAGWTHFDDPSLARPGDIGVQNGQASGGTPSNQTVYENHIGVVVTNPNTRNTAIMNNSSKRQTFTNYDETMQFTDYGYDAAHTGPTRFYRVPAAGIAQSLCFGP